MGANLPAHAGGVQGCPRTIRIVPSRSSSAFTRCDMADGDQQSFDNAACRDSAMGMAGDHGLDDGLGCADG